MAELSRENVRLKEEAQMPVANGLPTGEAKGTGLLSKESISTEKVESVLKDTIHRLYSDISSSQTTCAPPQVNQLLHLTSLVISDAHFCAFKDWVSLVGFLEQHTNNRVKSLVDVEKSLNGEVTALKDVLSKNGAERDDLARRNERYQSALNEAMSSLLSFVLLIVGCQVAVNAPGGDGSQTGQYNQHHGV